MTHSETRLDADEASQIWEQLSDCVDRLSTAWESTDAPPSLGDFVPEGAPAVRRMVLVELIKVDLEYRWRQHRFPKLIEEYLEEFPQLAAGGAVPCDLVYEEYHIRRQLGDDADVQDYFERFPSQAAELGRLLGLEAPEASTMLGRGHRAPQIEAGERLDDFDLLAELGKGAFASVFLARQRSMQRLVALKISGDRGCEPQTMAQLDHAHIVRVYDQRQLPERKLRLLYMQHIPGGTLKDALDERLRTPPSGLSGRLLLTSVDRALDRHGESPPVGSAIRRRLQNATWPEAVCWLGSRLASALHYAHEHGVLHRDVKPANVLLAADCAPKLADFNISFSSKLDGATPAAYFGGSLAYMSPEQLEACDPSHPRQPSELDGRSDVYSLAVLLWELLTGSRPFADEVIAGDWPATLRKMIERRQAGIAPECRARLPANCPAGFEEVLRKCLSPERENRFRSAADLARELDLCLQPRAQRLLHRSEAFWQRIPRRYPIVSLVVAGVLPNAAMSALNISYNVVEIIASLAPEAQRVFYNIQLLAVNGVAYSVGIGLIVMIFWPVLRALLRLTAGQPVDFSELPAVRARCLRTGEYAGWISAAEWAFSGLIFPSWLHAETGSGLSFQHFVHFVTSQVLCGLVAATLTFFFITYVAVHNLYPLLVQPQTDPAEAEQLVALSRRIWIYFLLAGAGPFLALTATALIDSGRGPVLGLGAVGLVAFLLALWFDRAIRTDLAALAAAVDPAGASMSTMADSSDSFWTGSR